MGNNFNVAILGAGNIANAMAKVLSGINDQVHMYAIASRTYEKAKAFADKWGFETAYGSYEELVEDSNIDLIYIATPHSEHYKNALLCIEHGRNCLVEKAFCGNLKQAKTLIELAHQKNVFIAEAMWTRYQPSKDIISTIINEGKLGEIHYVESDFSVPIKGVDRLTNPALAGGALLDLGVYSLTVPAMYLGTDIKKINVQVDKTDTGVDATTTVFLTYENGTMARAKCSAVLEESNYAKIVCDKGYMIFGPINAPDKIELFDVNGKSIETIIPEIKVNGYEYQVLECKQAIADGKLEPESMPHEETLRIMGWMDSIRCYADIVYPFETKEDISHDIESIWGHNAVFSDVAKLC